MNLNTPRMLIRHFTADDQLDLYAILGDRETMKYCEPPYSMEKTQAFLTSFCIQQQGAVAAVHKESGKMIGYILFHELSEGVYEMGWFFHRAFWGQGYAYESCQAVINYAFAEWNAHKIFAETIDGEKSVRLMRKLGMQPEGIQRSQVRDNCGNWADLYLYGLLRDDRKSSAT